METTPVFQVMFALQNAPETPREAEGIGGLEVEALGSEEPHARFDLEMYAEEDEGGLSLQWLYNRELFDGWRMERMAAHYERILEKVVEKPDARLSEPRC